MSADTGGRLKWGCLLMFMGKIRVFLLLIVATGVAIGAAAKSHPRTLLVQGLEPPPAEAGKDLIWAEEFNGPLDMTTADHVGRWRPCDIWQDITVGYRDFGARSWNINPNQHPCYSPFSVTNGILTITATRTPEAIVADIEAILGPGNAPEWSGGILISENRQRTFRYGYFEVRARWPIPGRGMFPAIWLYTADGRGMEDVSKTGAEIDFFEILGWDTGHNFQITLHRRDWQNKGDQIDVGVFEKDTTDWHTYGLDWQPEHIRFYYDGIMLAEVTGDEAVWFDVEMSFRLNFAVGGAYIAQLGRAPDETTPEQMTMEVEYVRVYRAFPGVPPDHTCL